MKHIYPDYIKIPPEQERAPANVIVEDPLSDIWYNHYSKEDKEILIVDNIEPGEKICFDCGGIYKQGEPELKKEINGYIFSCLLRHASYMYEYSQKIMTHLDYLGKHIYLPGYWIKIILTVETGDKIKEWLESQYDEDEAEWEWFKYYEALSNIPNVHIPKRSKI